MGYLEKLKRDVTRFSLSIKVGGFDQLFRNPPSKPSNVQVDEGLLETNFDLKAVTTSSFEMKFLDCPQPYPKVSK